MVIDGVNVISVEHRLPTENDKAGGALFVFHQNDTKLDGRFGYFNPSDKSWAVIGEPFDKDGETAYPFEDVTDWVDYWAIIPWDRLTEV